MPEGTMLDVRRYFNKDTNRTVTTPEFSAFWKSLTEDEKTYYKRAVVGL